MAYTTIDDPSAHFQVALYTGDGASSNTITNGGNSDLQPDWLWIKNRSSSGGTGPNIIFDSTRGATKDLHTNNTEAEHTNSNTCKSFNTDGFTVGDSGAVNNNTDNFVAWQWKANGGTTSSVSASGNGTDADTTKAGTYQANTTAGFSIVTFSTGAISNGDHRIEHGLGAVPHFIITKSRDNAADWYTYHHKGTDDNDYLRINHTNGTSNAGSRNVFDGSDFTSTYFEMDYNNILLQNENFVAYCFREIQGYSKFGSYTGNANDDGPFLYTGFKPKFAIFKASSVNGEGWAIRDSARDSFNQMSGKISANVNAAEGTTADDNDCDFLSNGIKLRSNDNQMNKTGTTFVYIAFAEHPFVSSKGVPCTAR